MRLEQLEALAITDDHEAQGRAWESTQHEWEQSPHKLRRLLIEKQVSASHDRARFVGIKAYLAAGGTLERDLFDDENEGYLNDRGLLDRLVVERCDRIAAALRAELAVRPDVALVAIAHNLASQLFYDQCYSLPTGLTVRSEVYTDRVNLGTAAESPLRNP